MSSIYGKGELLSRWREESRLLGILRRMALVKTNISEELSASIIRVARIGELGRS
jgi:hypothetical protein